MDVDPLVAQDWARLTAQLPADWRDQAAAHGLCRSQVVAGVEQAKLADPDVLLRLVLHHVATGASYAQTTAQAHAAALVTVSPVALHKRLRAVAPWLADLAAQLHGSAATFAPRRWGGFRLFATDATTGQRPGACGTTARVHYRLDLATLAPREVHVTDVHAGEMLRRFTLAPGDLDLIDRGYCNPADLAHARAADAHTIARLNRGTLPLTDAHGAPLDIEAKVLALRTRPGTVRHWAARVATPDGVLPVRVCATRLRADAAARAQATLRREAAGPVTATDLAWACFVVVVTTVPAAALTARQVLDLFRLRWQVELHIKRDKSLGGLAAIPHFRDDTIGSWLCAKLLVQALARALVATAPSPPWGVAA
jgi:hypothetical protein